jgi:hypothetical protein
LSARQGRCGQGRRRSRNRQNQVAHHHVLGE